MPQMQGNTFEISLDFQFGPIPAIFSAHAPATTTIYLGLLDRTKVKNGKNTTTLSHTG